MARKHRPNSRTCTWETVRELALRPAVPQGRPVDGGSLHWSEGRGVAQRGRNVGRLFGPWLLPLDIPRRRIP